MNEKRLAVLFIPKGQIKLLALPWWIPSLIEFVMMSGETAPKATPIITISSRMMLSNNN